MTIAAMGVWPWGRLRRDLASPWVDLESRIVYGQHAVLFASDSRFVGIDKDGKSVGEPIDDGAKLHLINRYTGLAFAGDVAAGERAVRLIRRYADRWHAVIDRSAQIGRLIALAHATEKAAYEAGRRKVKPGGLDVLVGFCSRQAAWGVRYQSNLHFMTLWANDVQTIGRKSAREQVQSAVAALEEQRFLQRSVQPQPEEWVVDLVAGITGAIDRDKGEHALIGGLAHTLVVKRNERGEVECGQKLIVRSKEKMHSDDPAVWEQIARRMREADEGVSMTNRLEDVKPLNAPRPRRPWWLLGRAAIDIEVWPEGA